MKVYDKEIYQKQESIKNVVTIILVFLIGFVAGYFASSFTSSNTTQEKENKIVIENVK